TIVVDAVLDQQVEVGADSSESVSESASSQSIGLGLDSSIVSAGFTGSLDGGADTDNSEVTTITITLDAALPNGASLSSSAGTISGTGPSYTLTVANGSTAEDAIDGLSVSVPGGYDGTISGTVSVTSQEANTPAGGDASEPDITDNTRTDSATFSV
ncbi:hypothetical protein WH96_20915, partial [Kiloniella spongiae]